MRYLFYLLFIFQLHAIEIEFPSPFITELDPSIHLEGGIFMPKGLDIPQETDLVIQGKEPVIIDRCYMDRKAFPIIYLSLKEPKNTHPLYRLHEFRYGATQETFYRYNEDTVYFGSNHFRGHIPIGLGPEQVNVGGVLSGRRDRRNSTLWVNEKRGFVTLQCPDGRERCYCRVEKEEKGNYVLSYEILPNGSKVHYDYQEVRTEKRQKKIGTRLTGIRTTNPSSNRTYANVRFNYLLSSFSEHACDVKASDGQWLKYRYPHLHPSQKKRPTECISSTYPDQKFHANVVEALYGEVGRKGRFINAEEIEFPLGRALRKEFYSDSPEFIHGEWTNQGSHLEERESDHFAQAWRLVYDRSVTRIKSLRIPAGPNGEMEATHFFLHAPDGSTTRVYDALEKRTDYFWDKYKRVTLKRFYNEAVELCGEEHYAWNDDGQLVSKKITGFEGRPLEEKHYIYNHRGDVLEEISKGNFSGKNISELEETKRIFTYRPCYYSSGKGTFFLVASEEDGFGKRIEYDYLYGTSNFSSELTYEQGVLRKRRFWEYNQDCIAIRQITDDGSSKDPYDLTDVTFRTILQVTPYEKDPYYGMPGILEEKYLDGGEERLLKKTVLHYTDRANISQKDIYDANGDFQYSLFYKYDPKGNLIGETDPLGRVKIHLFDACGNRIESNKPDPTGTTHTTYDYDLCNRMIHSKQVGSDGVSLEAFYTYDLRHNVLSEEKALGKKVLYRYNEFGHLIEKELPSLLDPQGIEQRQIYRYKTDEQGNPLEEIDPNGGITKKKYNAYGLPTRIERPDGSVETRRYSKKGELLSQRDPDGVETHFTYDIFGHQTSKKKFFEGVLLSEEIFLYSPFRLLSSIDAEGNRTDYSYDMAGRLIAKKLGDQETFFSYDSMGRLFSERIGDLASEKHFDALGQILEERKVHAKTGEIYSRATFSYDVSGNQVTKTQYMPEQEIVERSVFDSLGRLIQKAEGKDLLETISYELTPFLKETRTDAVGLRTIKTYNAHKKLSLLETFHKDGPLLQKESYSYDFRGNLTSHTSEIENPKRIRRILFEYDLLGRLLHQIEESQDAPKVTSYTYDCMGRQKTKIKPDQTILTSSYTPLGFLQSLESSDGSVRYTYTHDLIGRRIQVTDELTQKNSQKIYSPSGQVLTETQLNGQTLHYRYDSHGRKIKLILPDQGSIQYSYDACYLRAIERQDSSGIPLYTHRFDRYAENGQLLRETFPFTYKQGVYLYDERARLTWFHSPWSDDQILSRDPLGNVLRVNTRYLEQSYQYDALYQLLKEEGSINHTYRHDAHRCRLEKDQTSYEVNDLLQIPSHLQYDLNGNPIQQAEISYAYDALDRLIRVESPKMKAEYTYDADHRRMSKRVSFLQESLWYGSYWEDPVEQLFLYDETHEIASLKSSVMQELRVLIPSSKDKNSYAVAIELEGKTHLPIHDLFGNVSQLVDTDTLKPVDSYHYSAFGEEEPLRPNPKAPFNPWRFASKRLDPETSLLYYGRRYYSPSLGRWLTPDPAGFTDGLNLYAFVKNNPLIYTDFHGLYSAQIHPFGYKVPQEVFRPTALNPIGDPSRGMIQIGCGIGNTPQSVFSGAFTLYKGLDRSFAVQGLHLHSSNLIFGFLNVGAEKMLAPYYSGSHPSLELRAFKKVFDTTSHVPKSIDFLTQRLTAAAEDILSKNNNRLKQVHIAFSNGAYVYQQALENLTPKQRDTMIVMGVGGTTILNQNLAHRVYNFVGTKDYASQLCNGFKRSQRKAAVVPQKDFSWGTGGHYFEQPQYIEKIVDTINEQIKGNYEIY